MHNSPILIISPPRSGSSLLSNIIYNSGQVFGGEMKPPAKWNVNGYFENIAITNLMVSYLRSADTDNQLKRFNPINLLHPYAGNLAADCEQALKADGYDGKQQWFFKNPKLCWTWKIFAEAFPNAKWIVVGRPKKQVINSIMRTEFMDAYTTEQEWSIFYDRAEQNIFSMLRSVKNSHYVNINKLLDGDRLELYLLSKYLDLPLQVNCFHESEWGSKK